MQQLVDGTMHRTGAILELNKLLGAAPFSTATIRLFKEGFTPNPGTLRSAFVAAEADFDGYAAEAITWGAAGLNSTGNAYAMSQNATFACDGDTTPNTITGFWIDLNVAGPPAVTGVMSYFMLAQPIQVNDVGTAFGVKVLLEAPDLSASAMVEY